MYVKNIKNYKIYLKSSTVIIGILIIVTGISACGVKGDLFLNKISHKVANKVTNKIPI